MDNQVEINLNFRDKRPISEQLQEEMHRLIQEGTLPPGAQLPTVRNLAAQLRVNFNTVARVYRALDQKGLISTQRGRGSYILDAAEISQLAVTVSHEAHVERLINELLEKANKMQILPEELQAALARKMRPQKSIPSTSHRKKILSQKKRLVIPAWAREVRETNYRRLFSLARKKKKLSS